MLFGILGTTFFKGVFNHCVFSPFNPFELLEFDELPDNVDTVQDCYDVGGDWVDSDSNFNNVFSSMRTLFEMATTEGWTLVMWHGIDARGINL
jgi:hypothetical protein